MKISLKEKIIAIDLIKEACLAGARKYIACKILQISIRTIQRWDEDVYSDRRKGAKKSVDRKLSKVEEDEILRIANSDEYKDLNPHQIVPLLAEKGIYLGSESTFYRVLRKNNLIKHRNNQKPSKKRGKPEELVATGPDQVWCWDITYLKTDVLGLYYYCYMVKDIWTKEIVGWAIHDRESGELAEELFKSLKDKYDVKNVRLHSDNGAPMKKASLLITLYELGIMPSFSRPRVSNDNAYIESFFKTMKYDSSYPGYFKSITEAREWMKKFIKWYNYEHKHSAINYVTPNERRTGKDKVLLNKRNETLRKAYEKHPERWPNKIKYWEFKEKIYLNKKIN